MMMLALASGPAEAAVGDVAIDSINAQGKRTQTLLTPVNDYYIGFNSSGQLVVKAGGAGGSGSGTVTSAGLTVPTGLTVTGSPITSSGTFAITYTAGYQGFTAAEASKLSGIAAGAEVNVNPDWTAGSGDAQILNKPTLGTMAAETATNYLTTAAASSGYQPLAAVLTGTTASFTTALETKLNGIAAGAEVNVNPDWNAGSGDAQILNKPSLGTMAAETATNYLTTAAASSGYQPLAAVLTGTTASFTTTLETKLNGIEASANNYTLPAPGTTTMGGVKRNTGSGFVNGIDTDGSLLFGTPSGSGDVVGPASAVADHVAFFDGTTGKLIKDSGLSLSGSNTGDISLAGTPDYITISGQTITRGAVDLASDVTGTLPIANGGTGQTSHTNAFAALAPTTNKGDLIVSNGTDNVRVAVGVTNGHVLTVDSAEATGVKWAAGGGGGLTNITETLHTASPNNTVNAEQLEVTGGTTNTDLVLTPKGTGAFILGPEPDGTTTGGNKRGVGAVDFQGIRGDPGHVVSGNYSFAIGASNVVSGPYSAAIGWNNNVHGPGSLAVGAHSTASGNPSAAFSGSASGSPSFTVFGTANTRGAIALGEGSVADRVGSFGFSGVGAGFRGQKCLGIVAERTTTNTPVTLMADAGWGHRFTIPAGVALHATVNIIGVKSDGSAVARYLRQVTIKNVSGTTSLVGSVITLGTDEAAGTSISITADDTNDALKIEVTGITSETWRWVATIEGAEVAYGN